MNRLAICRIKLSHSSRNMGAPVASLSDVCRIPQRNHQFMKRLGDFSDVEPLFSGVGAPTISGETWINKTQSDWESASGQLRGMFARPP